MSSNAPTSRPKSVTFAENPSSGEPHKEVVVFKRNSAAVEVSPFVSLRRPSNSVTQTPSQGASESVQSNDLSSTVENNNIKSIDSSVLSKLYDPLAAKALGLMPLVKPASCISCPEDDTERDHSQCFYRCLYNHVIPRSVLKRKEGQARDFNIRAKIILAAIAKNIALRLLSQPIKVMKILPCGDLSPRWLWINNEGTTLFISKNNPAVKMGFFSKIFAKSPQTHELSAMRRIVLGAWNPRRKHMLKLKCKVSSIHSNAWNVLTLEWARINQTDPGESVDIVCDNDDITRQLFIGLQALTPLSRYHLSYGRFLWRRASLKATALAYKHVCPLRQYLRRLWKAAIASVGNTGPRKSLKNVIEDRITERKLKSIEEKIEVKNMSNEITSDEENQICELCQQYGLVHLDLGEHLVSSVHKIHQNSKACYQCGSSKGTVRVVSTTDTNNEPLPEYVPASGLLTHEQAKNAKEEECNHEEKLASFLTFLRKITGPHLMGLERELVDIAVVAAKVIREIGPIHEQPEDLEQDETHDYSIIEDDHAIEEEKLGCMKRCFSKSKKLNQLDSLDEE